MKFDAPHIGNNAFIAPSGLVLGKVSLGEGASVWYNATVRGRSGQAWDVHHGPDTDALVLQGIMAL